VISKSLFFHRPSIPRTLFPVLLCSLLLLDIPALAGNEYIPLQEIKPGMTGYGLTVFEGSRIDTFTVTVIGIQKKVRTAGSLILVEVAGHDLARSSIAQGMSGSPVFLDGRLAGALAFGWGGALRPLAGVTPAREILGLPRDPEPLPGGRPADGADRKGRSGVDMMRLVPGGDGRSLAGDLFGQAAVDQEGANTGNLLRGWPEPEKLARLLLEQDLPEGTGSDGRSPGNWFYSPLGADGSKAAGDPAADEGILRPGSACAVPLVSGDAQLGVMGTVTWVDGKDIFMMGHPFMQRGPVNLPLATAEILTVFPSRQLSFKLGSVGRIVGTVHHDQRAGLSGRLGVVPELIPVEAEVELPGGGRLEERWRKYSFQVVQDPQLTPTLVFWSLYNALLVEGDDASRQNLEYTITIEWEDSGGSAEEPLVLTGVMAGPGGAGRLATEWMAPISLLLNNPFREIRLKAVRASLTISRPMAMATINGVAGPRLLAEPGREFLCRVEVTPRLGAPRLVEVPVVLPADLAPGNYRLAVASAAEMFALDAERAPGKFQVTSLEGMMEILRADRAAGMLVVALLAPGRNLVLAGKELDGLPGRVARVIKSGNLDAAPTLADFVARSHVATDWFLQGHAIRNIKITPGAKPAKQERRP